MPNKKENKLVLYKDDEGKLSVNTLFADEDVWLTQAQLVEIYKSSKSNISEHLKNIFNDNELDKEVVVRKFRTTTQHGAIEGKTQTHEVLHYNLDVIIALGYRVQSPIAVRFRRWATRLLIYMLHQQTMILVLRLPNSSFLPYRTRCTMQCMNILLPS